jgi:hypothetical protein
MGHLWANRFFPTALDGAHLWSADLLALADPGEEDRFDPLRRATLTGRPCGGEEFIKDFERRLGPSLTKQRPGPRPRAPDDPGQMELKLE